MNKQTFERIKLDLYAKFKEIDEDQFINIAHNEMRPGYIVYKFEGNKRKLHTLTLKDIDNYDNLMYLPAKVKGKYILDGYVPRIISLSEGTEIRVLVDYLTYWNTDKGFYDVIQYSYFHELQFIIDEIIKEDLNYKIHKMKDLLEKYCKKSNTTLSLISHGDYEFKDYHFTLISKEEESIVAMRIPQINNNVRNLFDDIIKLRSFLTSLA